MRKIVFKLFTLKIITALGSKLCLAQLLTKLYNQFKLRPNIGLNETLFFDKLYEMKNLRN
jgi:hypothetical protein